MKQQVVTVGLDFAKSVLQVRAIGRDGAVLVQRQLRCAEVVGLFADIRGNYILGLISSRLRPLHPIALQTVCQMPLAQDHPMRTQHDARLLLPISGRPVGKPEQLSPGAAGDAVNQFVWHQGDRLTTRVTSDCRAQRLGQFRCSIMTRTKGVPLCYRCMTVSSAE